MSRSPTYVGLLLCVPLLAQIANADGTAESRISAVKKLDLAEHLLDKGDGIGAARALLEADSFDEHADPERRARIYARVRPDEEDAERDAAVRLRDEGARTDKDIADEELAVGASTLLKKVRSLLKRGKLTEARALFDGLSEDVRRQNAFTAGAEWDAVRIEMIDGFIAQGLRNARKNQPNQADADAEAAKSLGGEISFLRSAIESTSDRKKARAEEVRRELRERMSSRLRNARFIWLPQANAWADAYSRAMGALANPRDWRGTLREEQIQGFLKAREAARPRLHRIIELCRSIERLAKGDECAAHTDRCAIDLAAAEIEFEQIRTSLEGWLHAAIEDRQRALAL
ncbi:MAG: hypothetical protein Q8N23_28255 [Archangium sp.]|nr:hypothetical protein [Archangium sp.]MDP3576302.1 hypothetical protein [Archangium sp.]